MKLVGVLALFLFVALSSTNAQDDDLVGDKIPASAALAALQSAAEEGAEFIAADGVVAAVYKNDDIVDENPLLRKLFKKCKNGECRKKCNAKGQNGACVWFKCVCWK